MQPLVSVILTAYNAEKYIGYAIDSILGQTLSNFELFIVDDGSKDSTKAIIKTFSDERVVSIFNKTNRGQSYSRNLAVANARGKYIAIMDADDIAYPTRLQKQVEFMEQNQHISLCGSWAHLIDEGGKINGIKKGPDKDIEIKFRLLFYCPIIHPSVMWRKAEFDRLGLDYDSHFVYAQDFDLWTRAMAKSVEFHILQEPLVQFRFKHTDSISGAKTNLQGKYAQEIIERNFREFIGVAYQPNLGFWQQRTFFQEIVNAPFLSEHRRLKVAYFRKKLWENSKLPHRVKFFLRILAIN